MYLYLSLFNFLFVYVLTLCRLGSDFERTHAKNSFHPLPFTLSPIFSFLFCLLISCLNHVTAVTASTGIAAVNISGQTIHSWAGVGLAREPVETLIDRILRLETAQGSGKRFAKKGRNYVLERWVDCEVLVVDEVSMVDGKLCESSLLFLSFLASFSLSTGLLATINS